MELHSSSLQLLTALLVFLAGVIVSVKAGRLFNTNTHRILIIYGWHTLLSMTYLWYAMTYGADSIGYYRKALEAGSEVYFGSAAVVYLAALFVQGLGLSLLGTFLVFNIFGTIGLLIFDAALRIATRDKSRSIRRLATLIIFLPSVSFWTSALGKDSISFLATTLALWAALNISKRKIIMTAAIVLMLLVRPHVASIMIIAIGLSLLITSKQISLVKRITIATLVIPVAIVLVPFAANYAGIENFTDLNEVNEYIDKRQGYNMEGGGGVDISSMSPPMQVFTYLFRPLPYEAHSIFSLISSLDNLVLLLLFLYAIRFARIKSNSPANHSFLWLYVAGTTLILAMTTSNLGISVRQKWMIMPILLYLLFAGIAAHQARRQRKKQKTTYRTTPKRFSLR